MKMLLFVTMLLSSAFAEAQPSQVVLTAYTDASKYASSVYNFVQKSQDPSVTKNRFNILYQPSNKIDTEMVVGDLGSVVDLGATNCKNLPTGHETKGVYPGKGHGGYPYAEDRVLDPMFWLTYSEAWDKLQANRKSQITPELGHCYLVHQVGFDGVTVAMFHVKELVPGKMMIIDEMELFSSPRD